MAPDLTPTDMRVTELERWRDRLEPQIDRIQTDVTGLKSDMVHVVEGSTRIGSALEKLADAMTSKLVSDGAAAAVVSSDLAHLKAGVAALGTERAARQWPASAKAAVITALAAGGTQIISVLLGAPLLH